MPFTDVQKGALIVGFSGLVLAAWGTSVFWRFGRGKPPESFAHVGLHCTIGLINGLFFAFLLQSPLAASTDPRRICLVQTFIGSYAGTGGFFSAAFYFVQVAALLVAPSRFGGTGQKTSVLNNFAVWRPVVAFGLPLIPAVIGTVLLALDVSATKTSACRDRPTDIRVIIFNATLLLIANLISIFCTCLILWKVFATGHKVASMEKSNHGRRSSPPFGSTTLERGSGGGAGHRPSIPGSQTLIGSSSAGDGLNSKKPGAAASASQMLGQWAANNSLIRTMLVSKEAFVRISSFCFAIVLVGFFNIAVAVEDVVNIVNGNAGTSTSSSLGNVQTIVRAAIGIIYFGAMLSVKEIRRSLWIFRCCADPSTPREVAAPSNPEMLGTQLLGKRGSMGSIGAMADGAAGEHGTPAHALEAVVEATAECLESLEEV